MKIKLFKIGTNYTFGIYLPSIAFDRTEDTIFGKLTRTVFSFETKLEFIQSKQDYIYNFMCIIILGVGVWIAEE